MIHIIGNQNKTCLNKVKVHILIAENNDKDPKFEVGNHVKKSE